MRVSCSPMSCAIAWTGISLTSARPSASKSSVKPLPARAHGTSTTRTPHEPQRTRGTRVQMCLVPKEVQKAPALLRRVVCPAPLNAALRAGEGRPPPEVEIQIQSTSRGVERRPHNAPRPSRAQGLLEELSVTHGQPCPLTHAPQSHRLLEQRRVPISRCRGALTTRVYDSDQQVPTGSGFSPQYPHEIARSPPLLCGDACAVSPSSPRNVSSPRRTGPSEHTRITAPMSSDGCIPLSRYVHADFRPPSLEATGTSAGIIPSVRGCQQIRICSTCGPGWRNNGVAFNIAGIKGRQQ